MAKLGNRQKKTLVCSECGEENYRVSKNVKEKAIRNLATRGITLSEFLRFTVGKAADDDIELINFLDSPEALKAKKELETGNIEKIGTLDDLDNWMDRL